jgi:hypothetical protein
MGPGPSSYKIIIYRAAVSQRLGNTALDHRSRRSGVNARLLAVERTTSAAAQRPILFYITHFRIKELPICAALPVLTSFSTFVYQ